MDNYNKCIPIIAAALSVLVFGCLNLECFKAKQDGAVKTEFPDGAPNYLWLSLLALLIGTLTCFSLKK